jgi:peptide/nickel transport system substrate-binding protein
MTASFKAGEGQIMRMAPLQTVASMRDSGYEVITTLTVGATKAPLVLFPDSKNADSPFSKLKVREAVEYAIDKEAIVKALGYGFWLSSYQFPVKGTEYWRSDLPERRYDPAKAKQLLTEAGYPNGFKTRLIAQPGMVPKDAALAIQANMKAVGMDTEMEQTDAAKFAVYQQKGWNNALLMSNGSGGSPNFAAALKTGMSQSSATIFSVLIPDAYQKALDEAVKTLEIDTEKTKGLVKMLYDDETVIPVYYNFEGDPMVKGIHNLGSETVPGDPIAWTPDIVWMEKSAWLK